MAPGNPKPAPRTEEIKRRLKSAGINLDAYNCRIDATSENPPGFEFHCPNDERLVDDAQNSRTLRLNYIVYPGADKWPVAAENTLSFTEDGVAQPLHLDVSLDASGRGRAFLLLQPEAAKPVANPAGEQAAKRRRANAVKLRLRKAGVDLDTYKWELGAISENPLGFEFQCTDFKRLVQDAERSQSLALNFADLPGADPWRTAGVKNVGYTEIGAQGPVHIDIAIDRPGQCRVYLMPASVQFKSDAMRRAQIASANDNKVYSEIARRLAGFNPPIVLEEHIAKIVGINDTTLDGINFIARDYNKLKRALSSARAGGEPAFAKATGEDRDHWALKASFMATDGTGYREVFRVKLQDQPLSLFDRREGESRRGMRRFTAGFAGNQGLPDLTSLHCAVSPGGCNIHIDETGFVITDDQGKPVLDADFLQHLVNELLFKTYAKKILPDIIVNRVNLILPSSFVDFDRIGASVDLYKTKNFRVALSGTCSISGDHECVGTVTVSGRF